MNALTPSPSFAASLSGDGPADDGRYALRCGDVQIDRRTRRLRRNGQALTLGSRATDLLLALVDGRADVQSADTLRAAVWPDRTVGDNNLRLQVMQLRRLLGEQAIVHRPGRGYQLLAPVHEDAPSPVPPLMNGGAPSPRPGNLPEAVWPVQGRAELLAALALQVQAGARITLVGPGGAGKTALALVLAERAAAGFADGVWWVDLAPLRDSEQLPHAVAQALQQPVAREAAMDSLVHSLAGRQMLLVLDNCEHLLAAAAELSDRLLRAAPAVTLLATSRLPLRSAAEQPVLVPPLALPDAGDGGQAQGWQAASASGAVAVFEARARAGDARFRLTPSNAGTVVEICSRLDGHALSITLAAAQVPVLGLNAVRDGLAQRLRWTQRGAPGGTAPRHLSLQATLDWTYELLNPAEQQLLRCLGVFTGRFSLAAVVAVASAVATDVAAGVTADIAAGVAADVAAVSAAPGDAGPADTTALLQPLESLVAHGLVAIDSAGLLGAAEAVAQHTMHESARLYAHERLVAAGEADAARAALAQHLLRELRWDDADGPKPLRLQQAHTRLLPDVQSQVLWATAARPALAVALCSQAAAVWRHAGQHRLARRLAAPLLARPASEVPAGPRIDLLLALCLADYELEDLGTVLARSIEALALLDAQHEQGQGDDPAWLRRRGLALAWQADVHVRGTELALGERLNREALAMFRRAGYEWRAREVLSNLGWTLQAQGKFSDARPLLQEALALSVRDGDDWAQMVNHENLGELELAQDAPTAAAAHFERTVVLARRWPDHFRLANGQTFLALAYARTGDGARALATLHEALQAAMHHGYARLQVEACSVLAATFVRLGQPVRAHAALCAARHRRARLGLTAGRLYGKVEAEVEQRTRQWLSDSDCRVAQAQGELLPLEEALRWAADHGTAQEVAARP